MGGEYWSWTDVSNNNSGFHLAHFFRKYKSRIHNKNANQVPEFSHAIVNSHPNLVLQLLSSAVTYPISNVNEYMTEGRGAALQ